MEKWFVINKGADFEKLGKEFGISPVTARLIRNREGRRHLKDISMEV